MFASRTNTTTQIRGANLTVPQFQPAPNSSKFPLATLVPASLFIPVARFSTAVS